MLFYHIEYHSVRKDKVMLVIPQSTVNDILKMKELIPIIGQSLVVDTVLVLKAKVVVDSRVDATRKFQ